jgi:hypothetical protein
MRLLTTDEQRQMGQLVGEAITKFNEALAITVKARERVINGSVNVTAQFNLRNAIESASKACTTHDN